MVSMTTLALVSIALLVVVFVIVRRTTTKVDTDGITVSREWLNQHQSNDRS